MCIVGKRAKTTIPREITREIKHLPRFISIFLYSPCFPQVVSLSVEKSVENDRNCFFESDTDVGELLMERCRIAFHQF